ncbi:MAG: hypothetical protein EAZ76_01665 [Nostocales cyanobacterium]|nr:MAG: hypothetical protein EAZ87_04920 [Nostocales cyanobacterium]TAF20357.1 MAG: hypothetical protein EAZ76_01665 [Nostocales cyanobacterium]
MNFVRITTGTITYAINLDYVTCWYLNQHEDKLVIYYADKSNDTFVASNNRNFIECLKHQSRQVNEFR